MNPNKQKQYLCQNFRYGISFSRFPARIADLIGARLGKPARTLKQPALIMRFTKVEPGDLVFVDHPKYYDKCINSAASYIIINKETAFPGRQSPVIVDKTV